MPCAWLINGGLGRYLPARWPSYASVRVSFFYVGVDFLVLFHASLSVCLCVCLVPCAWLLNGVPTSRWVAGLCEYACTHKLLEVAVEAARGRHCQRGTSAALVRSYRCQ